MLDWLFESPVFVVIVTVPLFVVGGLISHLAFGGKKENKAKNDKLFTTTAYFNALRDSTPRKFR